MDIFVVFVSEYVEEGEEENIKQLKDHFKEGYERGEKGMLKRVHTNRRLEMSLVFLVGKPSKISSWLTGRSWIPLVFLSIISEELPVSS